MSERRLFVPPSRLAARQLTLTGPEHRHIARVLRARPGQAVTLFDGIGGEVDAEVVRVGDRETELALRGRREAPTVTTGVPLVLLAAIPRGARMDFLLQKTVELGVSRIVPVVMARSVVRPDAGKQGRWQTIAQEAARQSGRADVPGVDAPTALGAALADAALPARRFVIWEGEKSRALGAALAGAAPVATALLVGPEGGFAPGEVDAARAAGFVPAGLGPRILRVETAAMVAVALAQQALGGLG
jgi:16S rRNA (uracil1498-N3)-methyltransferase